MDRHAPTLAHVTASLFFLGLYVPAVVLCIMPRVGHAVADHRLEQSLLSRGVLRCCASVSAFSCRNRDVIYTYDACVDVRF